MSKASDNEAVVPKELRCAATGKPLFMPCITTQGVAYSYVALLKMFRDSQNIPRCKSTREPIYFFPAVCAPLHHFLMDEYKQAMRDRRRQDEAEIKEKYGLELPQVNDEPDEDGDDGFLEEFECVVSRELAYEPCALSSGSIVSAYCVPEVGFKKDPDRLVACALYNQAPKPSAALELMIKEKFPREYAQRANEISKQGVNDSTKYATGQCKEFAGDDVLFFGLGCDGCGIWPIRGSAWEDAQCPDNAGFHLCGHCYQYGYQKRCITGRFNQLHLPKHRMVEVPASDF